MSAQTLREMQRNEPKRPWGLIIGLIIAATAGLVSIPIQVFTYQQVGAASRADVVENRRLTEQVRMLEEMGNQNVEEHRVVNDDAHREQCRIIFDIARSAGIEVRPCEFAAP